MKINTFILCVLSLVACNQLFAGDDGFAGGLVGGLTGGMVAGAISGGGNRRDRDMQEVRNREHEKELDALRREKEKESIEQVRRALDEQKGSSNQSIIYILFFVVFCLMIGLGFLGFMVFRR